MTSNLRRTLQAALAVVVVVLWSAAAGAQESTEPPPAKNQAIAEPGSAQNFAASGEWLLSVENLFGYTYAHQSNNLSANTFTVLGDPQGISKSAYNWPRLALDMMVSSSLSVGVAGSFARLSASNGGSNTAFEGSVRAGYAVMPAPSLGIWPRIGLTYSHATEQSAGAVTIDALLVAVATPHLLLTLGPVADIGLWGKGKDVNHRDINVTYLNIGVYFGLTVPF